MSQKNRPRGRSVAGPRGRSAKHMVQYIVVVGLINTIAVDLASVKMGEKTGDENKKVTAEGTDS